MRSIVNRQKGITLIALVVTIIVLIILAGVSINMLVGENGIINMAQRAKNETEQAAKEEQQALASAFERNYVTYNGQLHVEGAKLMNEHNEEVRLRGTVLGNSNKGQFSKKIITNLKNEWNNNVIKVGCWSTTSGISAVYTDESMMQEMYQIIDDAIELDMYVIVIFWSGNLLTEDVQNEAIDYFTQVSNRYKNIPNIIYEIANEPSYDDYEWEQIKIYANKIIDCIRVNNSDALILCPTRGHNSVLDVIGNKLDYENVMYVAHVYRGIGGDSKVVSTAVLNDIPVFISEWSNASESTEAKNMETDKFIALMDRYNLSSTFFILSEVVREGSLAMVKQNMWDETLNENTLTETGLYAKRFFTQSYNQPEYTVEDYTMPHDANSDSKEYFWSDEYRNSITEIITTATIEIPENAVRVWDISNGSGNIVAYLIESNSEENMYTAYISGNQHEIYAYNYMRLFRDFSNLQSIDVSNLNTSTTNTIKDWFLNCTSLKEIKGLNNFDTSNVTDMSRTFYGLTSIEKLDLTSFDFSKVTNTTEMFANIRNGTNVTNVYVKDLEDAKFIDTAREHYTINIYYGTEDKWTKYEK